MHYDLYSIATGLEKSTIKLSVLMFRQCNLIQNSFKSQKMCNKDVNSCPSVLNSVPDHYMTQECVIKSFPKNLFVISCCPDRYKYKYINWMCWDSYSPKTRT